MAVTLREIADFTGFSKPTVTRILGRDAHLFNPDTRRKVEEAALKLGYRANAAARAMTSGRFGCAALILGSDAGRSDMPVGLLMGMQDELARRDMHLSVNRLPDEELTRAGFVPKVLRESMADGLLINYTHDIPEQMLDLIRASHAPAVWVNTKLEVDCVYPDDLAGATMLTEHLLRRGHRRIVYAKFDTASHYSTVDRRLGYLAAMQAAGLQPQVVEGPVPKSNQRELVRSIVCAPDRPTAVIVRPEDAATFLLVAAHAGLAVPRELSIACIAGAPFDLAGLTVCTGVVPADRVGKAAVRMLAQKIEAPDLPMPSERIPYTLVVGDTCQPPK